MVLKIIRDYRKKFEPLNIGICFNYSGYGKTKIEAMENLLLVIIRNHYIDVKPGIYKYNDQYDIYKLRYFNKYIFCYRQIESRIEFSEYKGIFTAYANVDREFI